MTTREEDMPPETQSIELGTVVVLLRDPSPIKRARLTTSIAAAVGLPSIRIDKDPVPGHLSYDLGVSANVAIPLVASMWNRINAGSDVSYLRIEGLSKEGLWVVETRPDPEGDQTPWRFVVSGPHIDG